MPSLYTPQLQADYQHLFNSCIIRPEKLHEVNSVVDVIIKNQSRYAVVADKIEVPWYFIGIVHCMEGSLSFSTHLHNGDPLAARTIQVPAGRPVTGNPPFKWEESAEDALVFEKVNEWKDWTLPGLLYKLEGFNGYGYRKLANPINSPYLWSCSNHYTKGKYVKDGKYDAEAVSKQTGAAVLLKRMEEKQVISLEKLIISQEQSERLLLIKQLGAVLRYDPDHFIAKALELQKALNLNGFHLDEDGEAGDNTSKAYFSLTGSYLSGDPRAF